MTTVPKEKRQKQELRFAAILRRVRETGRAEVETLCQELGVSVHTVRRDLEDMDSRGMLRRVHGGAEPLEPLLYEPFRSDRSFQQQIESRADEKRRIAKFAASLVNDGDVIGMTAGTTTNETVRCLPMDKRLTVVTNTVNVAMELCNRKDIEVFVTGGNLRGTWFSLVGPTAIDYVKKVIVDTLFIGVDGADLSHGLTCYNSAEAELNRVMVQHARRKILVADSSKFGVVASWVIAPFTDVDVIVTDTDIGDDTLEPYRQLGISVHRV